MGMTSPGHPEAWTDTGCVHGWGRPCRVWQRPRHSGKMHRGSAFSACSYPSAAQPRPEGPGWWFSGGDGRAGRLPVKDVAVFSTI